MSDEYPPLWVPVSAYFLPRGMSRAQYKALGLDVALQEPKTLRPDPKVVRDAVLTAKKLGFAVVRIDSMSLDLLAGPGLLETHFGAAFAPGDDGPPPTEDRLVDAKNPSAVLESAEPSAASPLRDLLFIITPATRLEPMATARPPGQPNNQGAAGKYQPWHVWPDELRQTLNGFESDGAKPPNDKHRSFQGSGAEILLVDSGIDRTHPWFITDLGIPLNDAGRMTAAAPIRSDLHQLNCQFIRQSSLAAELASFVRLIRPHAQQIRPRPVVGRFWLDPTDAELIRGIKVSDITIGRLDPDDADTQFCAARFYEYLDSWSRSTDVQLFKEFAHGIGSEDPTAVVDMSGDIRPLLDELARYLAYVSQILDPFGKWVADVLAGELIDLDGHGTQMAVSMLSIAGRANVRSFSAFHRRGEQDFRWYLKDANTMLHHGGFQAALDHATRAAGPELKIISNSWGSEFLPMKPGADRIRDCQSQIVYWRWQVSTAVSRDIVVCFAAGNSANPPHGFVSVQTLTGSVGAIIVGGAYKMPSGSGAFSMGDGDVYLSSAAHAYDYNKGGLFYDKGRIPDVCGLVGPELGIPNDFQRTDSPYVYLPTVQSTWHYSGGGTSSACAQVAGICALIRARYPGFSAADIKALIKDNGQAVVLGESFNFTANKTSVVDPAPDPAGRQIKASDFKPRLKLVSIRDAIKVASAKAALTHFTPAGGRP